LTILDFLIVDSLLIGDWRLLIAFDVRGSTGHRSISIVNKSRINIQHSSTIQQSKIKDPQIE